MKKIIVTIISDEKSDMINDLTEVSHMVMSTGNYVKSGLWQESKTDDLACMSQVFIPKLKK
jgi:hypothetical protein